METHTDTPQSDDAQSELGIEVEITRTPVIVLGTRGNWLENVDVEASFGEGQLVGLCRAKLIKESEYDSRTKHFYSAMDDLSNTMGDLAQLVLWSEGRWVFDGAWQGMKEYGDRNPVREQLDQEMRESRGQPSIRKYCNPVLYKPSEKDPIEPLPFPAGRHWLLLFTDITISDDLRGRNLDRAMVRFALESVRELARAAYRPLLAAVEPGCVQLKRFYVSDRAKFAEWYGSLWKHWPVIQGIKARQEKFWLEMGFQKFEKPEHNRDLSNFFFWSGLFQLPEMKDIDMGGLGKEVEGPEDVVPDAHMIMPEKRNARRVRPIPIRKRALEAESKEPGKSDKMDVDDGEAAVDKRPGKRDRTEDDDGEAAAADQRPDKRYRLADDMEVDPVELPQTFEATDQIGDGDIFDVINWEDYD